METVVYKIAVTSEESFKMTMKRLEVKNFELITEKPTLQVWGNPRTYETVELTLMF